MYGLIYKITNNVNGKVYIGLTTRELDLRISEHFSGAENRKTNSYLHRAIRRYGKDAFSVDVIAFAEDMESLNQKEIKYISSHNSFGAGAYNLTEGGGGCKIGEMSPENRLSISIATGGRPFLVFSQKGEYIGREVYQTDFAIRSGLLREQVSKSLNGRGNLSGEFILIFEDEFTPDELNNRLGRIRFSRIFVAISNKTGEIVGEWSNQTYCANDLGVPRTSVSACLNGKQRQTLDYRFEYISQHATL